MAVEEKLPSSLLPAHIHLGPMRMTVHTFVPLGSCPEKGAPVTMVNIHREGVRHLSAGFGHPNYRDDLGEMKGAALCAFSELWDKLVEDYVEHGDEEEEGD